MNWEALCVLRRGSSRNIIPLQESYPSKSSVHRCERLVSATIAFRGQRIANT